MLEEVARLARNIGLQLMQIRDTGGADGSWDGQQFKAVADSVAHNAWVGGLQTLCPDVPVISEEDVASQVHARPAHYWIIDPLDGTASYAGGFSGFVTQAALVVDSDVTASVVYAPVGDRLYIAKRGEGASLNGVRITCADPPQLEILVDNYPEPRGIALSAFDELGLARYVESGSISLKILCVADGTADLFIKDVPVRDWDIAAPKLIIEEAGGSLSTACGSAFSLQGEYEHVGIIAAPSREWSKRVAAWYNERRQRGAPD